MEITTVAQKGHVDYSFHYFPLPISSFLITNFQFGYFSFPILNFLIINSKFVYLLFPIWLFHFLLSELDISYFQIG
jgi:hypothetical protein